MERTLFPLKEGLVFGAVWGMGAGILVGFISITKGMEIMGALADALVFADGAGAGFILGSLLGAIMLLSLLHLLGWGLLLGASMGVVGVVAWWTAHITFGMGWVKRYLSSPRVKAMKGVMTGAVMGGIAGVFYGALVGAMWGSGVGGGFAGTLMGILIGSVIGLLMGGFSRSIDGAIISLVSKTEREGMMAGLVLGGAWSIIVTADMGEDWHGGIPAFIIVSNAIVGKLLMRMICTGQTEERG